MNPTQNQLPDDFQSRLKIFGDGWMLIIVSELLEGTCRFNELQRKVHGISPVTLTTRLKKLEQLGIVTRNTKVEDQLSVSYCVTEKGKAMKPALAAITHYVEMHFEDIGECMCTCEEDESSSI